LRTPVNAIIGYSELLLEEEGAAEQEDFCAGLRQLQSLGKQLQELIGEVLGSTRLDADPHLDLAAVAAEAQSRLQPVCQLTCDIAAALLAGAVSPELQGFSGDLHKILTAARQLFDLLADPFGGKAAGATAAASEPLRSPAPLTNEPRAATDRMEEFDALFERLIGHVLVVDDQRANRDMLARGLLRQGHHFALARDGRQALDMLASGAFDLVLLDIMMPEMDGFEVLSRLKADPQLSHVPVIMISALDQIDGVVRCIEMGAEDYLPKPFNPVLLQARVGACLEKKRLRDQELEYLRNVALVTDAATAVEAGTFDADALAGVADRSDQLGRLARVFQSMGREVAAREQRLQKQVEQLRIEIDQTRKAHQVAEITDTDYFQQLQQKVRGLRRRKQPTDE
jgi:DNA-binding response OmpR family regulator